jgi:hypothetical protein
VNWLVGGTITLTALAGLILASADVPSEFTSVGCDVTSEYATIWLKEQAHLADRTAHQFSIQFNSDGLVVRLPPTYYAPDWSQIDTVSMKFQSETAGSGRLNLRIHNVGEAVSYDQPVGTIQRGCWDSIRRYLHTNVEAKGIIIHWDESGGTVSK